jgi:hypothetical protein
MASVKIDIKKASSNKRQAADASNASSEVLSFLEEKIQEMETQVKTADALRKELERAALSVAEGGKI